MTQLATMTRVVNMMKSCETHTIHPMTADEATHRARYFLDILGHAPETVAELITALSDRALDTESCPVALYNRYMLSVAFREELLPNGWYDAPAKSQEFVDGPRGLLGVRRWERLQRDLAVAWEQSLDGWPSEQQVIDWNIHNDHADGIEQDA